MMKDKDGYKQITDLWTLHTDEKGQTDYSKLIPEAFSKVEMEDPEMKKAVMSLLQQSSQFTFMMEQQKQKTKYGFHPRCRASVMPINSTLRFSTELWNLPI